VALARPDVHGVLSDLGRLWHRGAVGGHDGERPTMDVHRMHEVIVRADEAQQQFLPNFHLNCVRCRVSFAVDCEKVRSLARPPHTWLGRIRPSVPATPEARWYIRDRGLVCSMDLWDR